MVDLCLLNVYTRTVLLEAAAITPPPDWTIQVAADSEVVLADPKRGHWVAIRMVGAGAGRRWRVTRGSLWMVDTIEFLALRDAVHFFCVAQVWANVKKVAATQRLVEVEGGAGDGG